MEVAENLGVIAIISLNSPLDMLKSRLQTTAQLMKKGQLKDHYKGVRDCSKMLIKNQGYRALWKGNLLSIVRFYPVQKLNFEAKNLIKTFLPIGGWANITSGILGGWFASAVFYPLQALRVRMTINSTSQKQTIKQFFSATLSQGLPFLFRGYFNSMASIAVFRGAYFGTFDTFKGSCDQNTYQKQFLAYFSALLAIALVHPFETIRKRKVVGQKQLSTYKFWIQIMKNEGISRGLFGGFSLIPIQCLAATASLIYFDSTKRRRQKNNKQ